MRTEIEVGKNEIERSRAPSQQRPESVVPVSGFSDFTIAHAPRSGPTVVARQNVRVVLPRSTARSGGPGGAGGAGGSFSAYYLLIRNAVRAHHLTFPVRLHLPAYRSVYPSSRESSSVSRPATLPPSLGCQGGPVTHGGSSAVDAGTGSLAPARARPTASRSWRRAGARAQSPAHRSRPADASRRQCPRSGRRRAARACTAASPC